MWALLNEEPEETEKEEPKTEEPKAEDAKKLRSVDAALARRSNETPFTESPSKMRRRVLSSPP